MNLGQRIKLSLDALNWQQSDLLARVPELGAQTLSVMIRRDSARSGYAPAIAQALGVNLHWLLTGDGEQWAGRPATAATPPEKVVDPAPLLGHIVTWDTPEDLPTPDGYVFVDHYDARFSAGPGEIQWVTEKKNPLAFRVEWARHRKIRPERCKAMYVRGDSMEPYLYDGDTILIDIGETEVIDGEVYALRYGEELRVKRLYKRPWGLLIRSDNRDKYPEEEVRGDDLQYISVLGRVKWRGG